MRRSLGVALVVVALVAVFGAGPAPAASASVSTVWVRPVDGVVVRPFDPPATRFGAGHLGTDFAAPAGTPVRAAGPGVVSFAGAVAGSLHVVVAHAGDLRTSYSFLASIAVRRGEAVAAGEVVGTTGGSAQGHDGTVVHLGLRAGDAYIDPMALFRPVDLVAVVHLAPTSDPPHPATATTERRGLLAGFAHDIGALRHVVEVGVDAAGRAAGVAARTAGNLTATEFPLPAAAARGVAAWLGQHGHCDPDAPPADGEGGSDHQLMLVAGIESSVTEGVASIGLPTAALGYEPGEVTNFSYAGGGDYTPADTEGPLLRAARRLGEQLRDLQRSEPGREVDLLAHSQGGVVVEAFLTQIYKPSDPSYPPLGTVVTISSPLRGDPLASGVAQIESAQSGRAVLDAGDKVRRALGAGLPPPDAAALRDLSADSSLMKELDAASLPDMVQLTTLGAATDVIVPANDATRPGARGATVVPSALNAHTGILTDPSALRVVRAALEGKPLPCTSLMTAVAGEVLPAAISRFEHDAGDLGAAVAHSADTP